MLRFIDRLKFIPLLESCFWQSVYPLTEWHYGYAAGTPATCRSASSNGSRLVGAKYFAGEGQSIDPFGCELVRSTRRDHCLDRTKRRGQDYPVESALVTGDA